jgi:hypothetical protein
MFTYKPFLIIVRNFFFDIIKVIDLMFIKELIDCQFNNCALKNTAKLM